MAPQPDPTLIAYYPFDGNGDDASGNHRDLEGNKDFPTYPNKYSTGKFGQALGIPQKDYQGVGLQPKPTVQFPLNLKSSFTIVTWICVYDLDDSDYVNKTGKSFGQITGDSLTLGFSLPGGTPFFWYHTSDMADASQMPGNISAKGQLKASAMGNACQSQTWNHLAVTFDRQSSQFSIYLNGSLDSVQPLSPPMSSTATMDSMFYGVFQPTFSVLDDFAFFSFALSAEQVNKIYNANKPLSSLLPLQPETCSGLPAQVALLRGEWEGAGIKTDCVVDRLMAWTVNNASAPGDTVKILNEALGYLRAMGYEHTGPSLYSQATIDAWRNTSGIATAFAAWKGTQASIIYLPQTSEYVLFQYRWPLKPPAQVVSAFTIEINYQGSWSDAEKKIFEKAANYWQARIADKRKLTLEVNRDPAISAHAQTLVGDVPGSCYNHQPLWGRITVKDQVNDSLISHKIGHFLGIGDASIFKPDSPCGKLAQAAGAIPGFPQPSAARIGTDGVFHGPETDRLTVGKGIKLVKSNGNAVDFESGWGHVDSSVKDSNGQASAVQPSLGGKPSLLDFAILKDLGYTLQ
jgi:hypothetical protein